MPRWLSVLALALVSCGGPDSARDAAAIDAVAVDGGLDAAAVDCDGGCAGNGEVCGTSDTDRDAGALPCGTGLVCCYPCGIPDCADRCTQPCGAPGPGCQENGCPGPFP